MHSDITKKSSTTLSYEDDHVRLTDAQGKVDGTRKKTTKTVKIDGKKC